MGFNTKLDCKQINQASFIEVSRFSWTEDFLHWLNIPTLTGYGVVVVCLSWKPCTWTIPSAPVLINHTAMKIHFPGTVSNVQFKPSRPCCPFCPPISVSIRPTWSTSRLWLIVTTSRHLRDYQVQRSNRSLQSTRGRSQLCSTSNGLFAAERGSIVR